MTEIKLTKRYPNSRTEDITDAYMRGWNDALDAVQNGKFHIAKQTEPKSCDNCEYEDLGSSEGACDTCEDVKGEPTNWTPKQTEPIADTPQTDCSWK